MLRAFVLGLLTTLLLSALLPASWHLPAYHLLHPSTSTTAFLRTLALWAVVHFVGRVLYLRYHAHSSAQHPEQVRDVARAMKWVQTELTKVAPFADTRSVFVRGHSAGNTPPPPPPKKK
jgi:hypothetical protein